MPEIASACVGRSSAFSPRRGSGVKASAAAVAFGGAINRPPVNCEPYAAAWPHAKGGEGGQEAYAARVAQLAAKSYPSHRPGSPRL